jgi:hypothetical protein
VAKSLQHPCSIALLCKQPTSANMPPPPSNATVAQVDIQIKVVLVMVAASKIVQALCFDSILIRVIIAARCQCSRFEHRVIITARHGDHEKVVTQVVDNTRMVGISIVRTTEQLQRLTNCRCMVAGAGRAARSRE